MHRDEEREVAVVERGPAGRVPRQARAADHALLRRRPHQAGRGESSLSLDSYVLIQFNVILLI